MLIGDSQGSMYGRLVRDIAHQLEWPLVVASAAAGDSLPRSDGTSSQLWKDTLTLVALEKPDIIVMANYWSSKLQDDRGRLRVALDALASHVDHIVIIDQIPILPATVNRAAIRDGLSGPFLEVQTERIQRLEVRAARLKRESMGSLGC